MLGGVTTSPPTYCHGHLANMSSAALALRAKDGGADATAELFRRLSTKGRLTAASWCHPSEVDDAVAEGFTRAFASFPQLRQPAAVESWILRCVARAAMDLSRRAARQRPSGSAADLDWRFAPSPSAADAAMVAWDRIALRRAWADVPDRHRQLLDLRFNHGLSVREIALQMGAPEGTLRRHCMEATRLLEQGFLCHQLCPPSGTCAPVTRLLCRGVRRQLSGPATRTVTAHLRYCRGCRQRRDELGVLVAGLNRKAGPTSG
jgi:RNA polymerase sigma factor (sigma-70 family)